MNPNICIHYLTLIAVITVWPLFVLTSQPPLLTSSIFSTKNKHSEWKQAFQFSIRGVVSVRDLPPALGQDECGRPEISSSAGRSREEVQATHSSFLSAEEHSLPIDAPPLLCDVCGELWTLPGTSGQVRTMLSTSTACCVVEKSFLRERNKQTTRSEKLFFRFRSNSSWNQVFGRWW